MIKGFVRNSKGTVGMTTGVDSGFCQAATSILGGLFPTCRLTGAKYTNMNHTAIGR